MVFFDKLTFSEVTCLYEGFQRYYEEWVKSSKLTNIPPDDNFDIW